MTYGVILAGGVGNRMGKDIPKQFLKIRNVPIIVYTINAMVINERIDRIIISCHSDYILHLKELINNHFDKDVATRIDLITGGKERIDSIDNSIKAIKKNAIESDDVVIFHDAVRPFVTQKILNDSIDGAREKGAVVAGLAAVDTMLVSKDGDIIDDIPQRSTLFNGQAPDSFRVELLLQLRDNISEDQKNEVFGTSKLCELNGEPMYMIPGDEKNFKITTPEDLKKAEFYLQLIEEEDNESFKSIRNR